MTVKATNSGVEIKALKGFEECRRTLVTLVMS